MFAGSPTPTSWCWNSEGPAPLRPVRPPVRRSDQGVGAVSWAGDELVPAVWVGVAEDSGPLDEEVDASDDEVVDEEDSESGTPVSGASDGEVSAGAVVVGDDGLVGVVSWYEDTLVSSSRVVDPDESELPTSADTGFCPMSSIPVTMPMATTKTATA